VMLPGMMTLRRLAHPANASCPMPVTLLGIVTLARLEQRTHPANAGEPLGMVTRLGESQKTHFVRCWRQAAIDGFWNDHRPPGPV